MELITLYILVGALLLIASVLTSLISFRIGAPLLLIFLGVGLAAGEDGLGIEFDNAPLAFLIGSVALAFILFESGFSTRLEAYRVAAWPAITLATVGVVLTTAVMGVVARYVLDSSWLQAFLIGAIVSSTDAAAVFFLLRVGGTTIRERVRSTLEIESSTNDPMAIFLTISLVELIAADAEVSWSLALDFLRQMGGGALLGVLGGLLITFAFRRLRLEAGLYPVLSLAMALFVFAATSILGGSGFLAVYIAGLMAGNSRLRAAQGLHRFHDGLTWLSQIVMFVTLGLLATPSEFPTVAVPALALALTLIFVARPIAVWLCLLPFRFSRQEVTFIAWVGLRGAVSILLAIVPILGALEVGQIFFNFVFLIVVLSLLAQGWTIRSTARWLGLIVPPRIGPINRVEIDLPDELEHELVAYTIRKDSPVARGQRLPRWARPSLIIRDRKILTIRNVRQLQAGDHVYLFAPPQRVPLLDTLFAGTRELSPEDREFFGDLALNPRATLGALAETYGLPLAAERAELTLHELFAEEFRNPELGDRLRLGSVELIVREIQDGQITSVGLALEPPARPRPRMPSLEPGRYVAGTLRRLATRTLSWRHRRPVSRKQGGREGSSNAGDTSL